MLLIREARDEADRQTACGLLQERAASPGVDLGIQDSDIEAAALLRACAPPGGCVLLVEVGGVARGCVALRTLSDGVCEMARLHVRSESSGHGLGRTLARAAIWKARELGYSQMRLSTSSSLVEETGLYEDLGFREIASYERNPTRGARFFELDLAAGRPTT